MKSSLMENLPILGGSLGLPKTRNELSGGRSQTIRGRRGSERESDCSQSRLAERDLYGWQPSIEKPTKSAELSKETTQ